MVSSNYSGVLWYAGPEASWKAFSAEGQVMFQTGLVRVDARVRWQGGKAMLVDPPLQDAAERLNLVGVKAANSLDHLRLRIGVI